MHISFRSPSFGILSVHTALLSCDRKIAFFNFFMCYFHIKGWNVFYIDIASIWLCCIFWEWVVICFIIGVVIIQVFICNFPFFEIFLCFCTINTTIYLSYFLWNPPLSLIICVRFWTMFFANFFSNLSILSVCRTFVHTFYF